MPLLPLPMDAGLLIPHRPPVQLIDRLLSFDGDSGVVEARIGGNHLFLKDRAMAAPLLLELMAQSCAALKGYQDLYAGKPIKKGFLVAIKRARFVMGVEVDERLLIKVKLTASFNGFTIAETMVEGGAGLVASGEIKLWVPDESVTGESMNRP